MLKIENIELSKIMRAESQQFAKLVASANKYAHSNKSLDDMILDPRKYCSEMLPKAAHSLELPLEKLFELYQTPVQEIEALASQLEANEYYQFINEVGKNLELDIKAIDEYIKAKAVHELNGKAEKIYRVVNKVVSDLNKLQMDLKKEYGSTHQLNPAFSLRHDGLYKMNIAQILNFYR